MITTSFFETNLLCHKCLEKVLSEFATLCYCPLNWEAGTVNLKCMVSRQRLNGIPVAPNLYNMLW